MASTRNRTVSSRSPKGRRRPAGAGRIARELRRKISAEARYFDYDMVLVIIFLICFGLVMLYSTSFYEAAEDFGSGLFYFRRQAAFAAAGLILMLFVARFADYRVLVGFSPYLYWLSIVLMSMVRFTPFGQTINGARRWLKIGISFQPSEIAKLAVILLTAFLLCRMGGAALSTGKGLAKVMFYIVLAAGGVYKLTDNLSTGIIVFAIGSAMVYSVHKRTKFVLLAGIALFASLPFIKIILASFLHESDTSFRLNRVFVWLDPASHMKEGGFQVMQGLYAIGSGGFFGKGLGNSMQKLGVIPEAQNDMIFSIICEELGVFGVCVMLLLFALLLYRLKYIANHAPDLTGSLIATGVFAHIALQVILNMAVVTNVIPTTGITLPFISFGGTSVVFLLVEMGVVLNVSRQIKTTGRAYTVS